MSQQLHKQKAPAGGGQQSVAQELACLILRFFLRLSRRMLWIVIPVVGLFAAMAAHSALLTGVCELVIIIVVGVWVASVFDRNKHATFGQDDYYNDNKAREPSYLERDQAYMQEQLDAYQQEREEHHQA